MCVLPTPPGRALHGFSARTGYLKQKHQFDGAPNLMICRPAALPSRAKITNFYPSFTNRLGAVWHWSWLRGFGCRMIRLAKRRAMGQGRSCAGASPLDLVFLQKTMPGKQADVICKKKLWVRHRSLEHVLLHLFFALYYQPFKVQEIIPLRQLLVDPDYRVVGVLVGAP